MQPKQPCAICRLGFPEKALTAYHAWYQGQLRVCYKQRMCIRCWKVNYADVVAHSTNQDDYDAPIPETCYQCGEGLGDDRENTWSTWYRGQSRKDTVLPTCPHCAAQVRTLMMSGADRQEDRPLAGSRAGGAPLPGPQPMPRGDLPW